MPFSSENGPDARAPLAGLRYLSLARSDLDQVLEIETASFASAWQRHHFEMLLRARPGACNRVARLRGRVLGYLCAQRSGSELKINNLAVRAEYRRRGVGRWLLREVLREGRAAGCSTALLEVRPSNAAALGLYAEFGFEELGRIPGYYRDEGEDALVLQADLAPADLS